MNTHAVITNIDRLPFWKYIWGKPTNRKYLYWGLGIPIVEFIIFKILYPYPDFFSDSYNHLFTASAHLNVGIWPIGYSKFLSFIHTFTDSDTIFVGLQYFLFQFSALIFYCSILYIYRPGIITRKILFIFLFVNPLFLYLNNFVNSDPLFSSLSLLWFSQLLWILYKPRIFQLFIQAILLFLCFTVRNNAYYYPLVASIVICLSHQKFWIKLLGVILPFSLIIPFILYTRNLTFQMTGTSQYSFFTGWQLANNALYIYDKIHVDSNKFQTPESKEINNISRAFFSQLPPKGYRDFLSSFTGNFFIRYQSSPLKQYLKTHYTITNDYTAIVSWGKASAVFELFGRQLISDHPFAFARYYLLLNLKNYLFPPLDKLEVYNMGISEVWPIAQKWFHYKSNKVTYFSNTIQAIILSILPPLFLIINLLFLIGFLIFALKAEFRKKCLTFNRGLLSAFSFLLINFVFSIFATIIVFRYQIIPMIIGLSFSLLLLETYINYFIKIDVKALKIQTEFKQSSHSSIQN